MTTTKFYIQSLFYDTLTNGFRDDINNNTERLGFILGAIDCGFSICKTPALRAKKGLVTIYLRSKRDSNGLAVTIFKKDEKQGDFEYSIDGFLWVKIKLQKGRLYLENRQSNQLEFICSIS